MLNYAQFRLWLALTLLQGLLISCSFAASLENDMRNDTRRWISIPDTFSTITNSRSIWPPYCLGSDIHAVTYCFVNQESDDALHDLLGHGIAKWATGLDLSSLRVMHDPWCADTHCLCDVPAVDIASLRIKLDTSRTSACTIGYTYGDEAGRHLLNFRPTGNLAEDILEMTHELDQRPDRDLYVDFNCKAVAGYDEALQGAMETPFFEDHLTGDQRMDLICSDGFLAETYLPTALTLMKYDDIPERGYQTSLEYDRDSIMHYGSYHGRQAGSPFNPLTMKGDDGVSRPFPQCGQWDPANAGPSLLDNIRLQDLYPALTNEEVPEIDPQHVPRAPASTSIAHRRYKVVIPGMITTIVSIMPAPSPSYLKNPSPEDRKLIAAYPSTLPVDGAPYNTTAKNVTTSSKAGG